MYSRMPSSGQVYLDMHVKSGNMCLYMLLVSDTQSKGAHAVKQMVGLFIICSKIWRVESPVETGTHIHCLYMTLISGTHRVIARNC